MANQEPKRVISFERFCSERGLVGGDAVFMHINASLRSQPTTKSFKRWNERRLAELQDQRDASRAAYLAAIAAGEFDAPNPSDPFAPATIPLEEVALRDDDRGAAARRVLAKRAAREAQIKGTAQ